MPAAAWLAPAPALPRSNTVTVAPPASRQAMPSPTTPAPMMATCGFLPIWGSSCGRGGSLRWNDPDRFDGFDLSRAFVARHPRPKQQDNGGFSPSRQGRVSAADAAGAAQRVAATYRGL